MRILQLITRRQRRGAEVFATELADGLAARGHEVVVLSLYGPHGTPLEADRVEIRDLGATNRLRLDPRIPIRLARAIRRFVPDVVQANGSDTLKYSVVARSISRERWPIVYRNISIASRWLGGPLHRRWNHWLVHRVERVVAVSQTSADDFVRTYGVPAERMVVIPQSVRIPDVIGADDARRTLAALAPVPHDAPILMHVGSFTPEKNHVWLLRRFREIQGTHPDAHLVLVGDGPLRATVDRVIKELGLSNRVHCLGSRTDAATLVAAAHILVLPSLVEGLPGVVLEAAACAVPAVASDVGGVSEAIVDGETGILIETTQPAEFVTVVGELISDEPRRSAMGRRARHGVEVGFNSDRAVSAYEATYLQLVTQSSGTNPDPKIETRPQ